MFRVLLTGLLLVVTLLAIAERALKRAILRRKNTLF
jgi:hypothetical protein